MYQAVEGDNKIPVNSTHLRLFEGWFVPWGRAGFFYVGKFQIQIRRPTPGNNINQNLKPPQKHWNPKLNAISNVQQQAGGNAKLRHS